MRFAKRVLRALIWFGGAMLGLVVVIYLVFLGVNVHDRPVAEAAVRLEELSRDRAPVADEDNAYVYLMGFAVDREEDPRAWGIKRISWAQRLVEQSQNALISEFPGEDHDLDSTRSADVRALSETCRVADRECLAALESGEQTIAEWMATEEWVLARYKTLLAHLGWLETVPFDVHVPLPGYSGALEGQKLLLIQAWLLAGQGDVAGVRKLLEEDVRFWRQSLTASDLLISKMIAVAALKRHFTWSSIILRRLPSNITMDGVPQLWLAPITESERSMLRCLTGEWLFFNSSVKRAKESDIYPLDTSEEESAAQHLLWRVLRPMLQFQDTSNRYAELLISVAETLHVPYEQYPAAVERARAIQSEAAEAAFPSRIYNILGDSLFFVGTWDFTSYAVRVADIEGLRRIALLAAELRNQGIASEQVPQKLSEAVARDPYNGKPFLWDESAKAIVFTGLEHGERGRHAILY